MLARVPAIECQHPIRQERHPSHGSRQLRKRRLLSLAKSIESGPARDIPAAGPPAGPPPEPEWGMPQQRFGLADSRSLSFLSKEGHVVTSGALSDAEGQAARAELWKAIEDTSQTVRRNDPATWNEG